MEHTSPISKRLLAIAAALCAFVAAITIALTPTASYAETQAGLTLDSYSVSGDVVTVTFTYTNLHAGSSGDYSAAYDYSLTAYQDGQRLSYKGSGGDYLTQIKPGYSRQFTYSWSIVSDGDVQVEAKPSYNSNGADLARTLTLANGTIAAPAIEAYAERLYTECLGRDSDASGKAAQVNAMRNGMGAAQVAYNFFNSAEFKNLNLSYDEQINRAYRTLLNRDADEEGLAYWRGYLESGMSINSIVAGFAESPEFTELCGGWGVNPGSANGIRASLEPRDRNAGITAFASRLYTDVLGRNPETDGLNAQCQGLADGIPCWQIAYNFFNSEEFANKHLSADEIVAIAYGALLGRDDAAIEADAAGRAYWVERYEKNGLLDIVQGFCQSDEFEAICQSCGMTSGMR